MFRKSIADYGSTQRMEVAVSLQTGDAAAGSAAGAAALGSMGGVVLLCRVYTLDWMMDGVLDMVGQHTRYHLDHLALGIGLYGYQ
jgi:hypothetical protein